MTLLLLLTNVHSYALPRCKPGFCGVLDGLQPSLQKSCSGACFTWYALALSASSTGSAFCLQELFEAPYFCQEQKEKYYRLAKVGTGIGC